MASEEKITPPALPPQVLLYHMATGHYLSRALDLAATLGIADRLKDGPRPAGELAQATATHAPSLHRVLRLLASAGVLAEEKDGAFALTPIGECLRTDTPGSAHAMVKLFAGPRIQDNWKDLPYCVRTGEPAFRQRGLADPFSDRDPEDAANFDAAMANFTRLIAVAVAASFTPFGTVVDVGGGNGALLIGLLQANPALRGIVFDLPAAAERATKQIAASALQLYRPRPLRRRQWERSCSSVTRDAGTRAPTPPPTRKRRRRCSGTPTRRQRNSAIETSGTSPPKAPMSCGHTCPTTGRWSRLLRRPWTRQLDTPRTPRGRSPRGSRPTPSRRRSRRRSSSPVLVQGQAGRPARVSAGAPRLPRHEPRGTRGPRVEPALRRPRVGFLWTEAPDRAATLKSERDNYLIIQRLDRS
jgi:hypothetical protein